jgi:hypothetical protein
MAVGFTACDATVTGISRMQHIRNVIGGNSTLPESALDALKSDSEYSSVDHCDALQD